MYIYDSEIQVWMLYKYIYVLEILVAQRVTYSLLADKIFLPIITNIYIWIRIYYLCLSTIL